MAMRAKHLHTSFSFLVLITKLCQKDGVPRDEKRDIEVIAASTTHIWRIEFEYILVETDMRRTTRIDACLKVDVESIPIEVSNLCLQKNQVNLLHKYTYQ